LWIINGSIIERVHDTSQGRIAAFFSICITNTIIGRYLPIIVGRRIAKACNEAEILLGNRVKLEAIVCIPRHSLVQQPFVWNNDTTQGKSCHGIKDSCKCHPIERVRFCFIEGIVTRNAPSGVNGNGGDGQIPTLSQPTVPTIAVVLQGEPGIDTASYRCDFQRIR